MSRLSKKNLLASLALMTFTSQLVAAQLALPMPPAAPSAVVQTSDPATQTLPSWTVTRTFEQLGRASDTLLLGINSSEQVEFSLRRDRIATDARLQLQYTPSPSLIPTISHLRIYLNDVLAGVVPIEKDQLGRQTTQQVALDPRLIADFNRLRLEFVGHYTDICEDPANNTLWINISRASEITLQEQALSLKNDLAFFPLPFFDPRNSNKLVLPFVFADNPTLGEQKAAAILASYFGSQSNWRGAEFPVLFNTLPSVQSKEATQPSIVFATNDHRPAFLSDLEKYPAVQAPVVQLIDHPDAPYSKILLVMGRNEEDLATAAKALALGGQLLRGQRATIDKVQTLQPRKPYDAPAWMRTDRPVRFAELITYPQQLQVSGLQPRPITLDVNLPPDLFVWRNQGIPLRTQYRYTAPSANDDSRLNISLNDQFITSLPLLAKGTSSLEELRLAVLANDSANATDKLIVPSLKIGDRNRLRFDFNFASTVGSAQRDRCQTILPADTQAIIDEDSTIDLSGYHHYINMPDLKAFARSGFPFSRMADMSESIVVVPKQTTPTLVSTLLESVASISARTGYPAFALRLSDDWNSASKEDADLLLLGQMAPDLRDNPDMNLLLQRQHDMLVQPYNNSGIKESNRRGPNDVDNNQPANRVEVSAQAPIAAIMGMQSPHHNQRSIVALLGNDDADYSLIRETLGDSGKLNAVAGSVALIRNSGVYSQLVGDTYYVGSLPWWLLLWYQLSEHPVLLAALAVISILLTAFLLWRALRWAADRRLHKDE
ncbi:cellulose synthase regulator BcsB [Pseudomonas lundensis]|uniref:cellulose biosynthesis cyclic di-GMP-binding regulatory protein BcsB n=1 Tax=Pseudomonas lundensis TaxID=86185 RepID=UPI000641FE28|nr:cellulose biosynthesis cyclic di-GMP-binding regulatory protein BcsB [Pseudomonas lundensis]AOZ14752.1 cellulose synthase regulator BcsB [Pseudomonas lundensis]NNA10491.1 cellulose biosynthesis cyclic di-GMP-binding regulatory protein BcsB [Pseudomonas lundensis]QVQ77970.1 cellulose biosynthesis cyclic di-GMP-binding regulatory protein BcsB [Pseudomonas lundensis]QVQ82966.1 cellulose biosynthesis cyclic di-GMP-binding regulatory protein BcsB [Pseudomonas lundensis]